jgi:hypothetical protein
MTVRVSKTKSMTDREYERYSYLRDLAIRYEGQTEKITVRAPDISPHGMFVNTCQHFPEGAILQISFLLPQTGTRVKSRCEVRYALPGVGVGVEFMDISPADQRAIRNEIKRITSSQVVP